MEKIDIFDGNWWANFVIGLLDKGEWKILITGLVLTYAGSYILRIIYKSFVNKGKNPNHIRLMAIISGFVAAWGVWKDGIISMDWYIAGIALGPLSIALYHLLLGASASWPLNKYASWIYPLIKGPGTNKRSGPRLGAENRK